MEPSSQKNMQVFSVHKIRFASWIAVAFFGAVSIDRGTKLPAATWERETVARR
jgi:hypothetical protein